MQHDLDVSNKSSNKNSNKSTNKSLTFFDRVERYWRIFATGLSFVAFGIGGLFLTLLVFPLLRLFVWHHQKQVALARKIIQLTFRAFIGLMRILGVLKYEILGLDKLAHGGVLILANHPTLIDTVFLMAFVDRVDCVVKSQLWNNIFTRGPVRAAGYIHNEKSDELVAACITSLRNGNNLIIFPEGTRTPKDGMILLKRGAANIAVRGECDITPVVIRCEPRTLGKGEKWWQVPVRLAQFHIEVKENILIGSFKEEGQSDVVAVRQLTNYLQKYFTQES